MPIGEPSGNLVSEKKRSRGIQLRDFLITIAIGLLILGVVAALNWGEIIARDGRGAVWRVVPSGEEASTGPTLQVGKEAPDFEISLIDTVNGQISSFRLSDYRGKVVWFSFWASWCPPCRAEMPEIEEVWQEIQDKDVILVAIAFGEPLEDSISYMQRNGFSIPVGQDSGHQVATRYRLVGLPTHFFIDAAGIIQGIRIGPLSASGMRQRLEEVGQRWEVAHPVILD